MKYIILLFLFSSLSFAQTDMSTSESLEEDIVGTISPPTQEHKQNLKNQLKKKHKKDKSKTTKNKKIKKQQKKNIKHKNK